MAPGSAGRSTLGVTTSTFPVVAPTGTVVVIKYLDTTVNKAAVTLQLTLVAAVRLFPRISTNEPAAPPASRVSTNGAKPIEKRNTVP